MTVQSFILRSSPFVVSLGLASALANCSSNTPEDTAGNAGKPSTGGTNAMAGMGGSTSLAGQTAKGGSTSAGTGGTATGGAGASGAGRGGAGMPAGGMPGMAGMGAAGKGMAGGAGMLSTGGAPSGGVGGVGGMANGGVGGATAGAPAGGSTGTGGMTGGTFALTSPMHMDGAKFDPKYTCDSMSGMLGGGVNPELDWSGIPTGTKSFAMTFIDTTLGDTSPMGQHWAIWNIPPTVTKIAEATTAITADLMPAKQSGKFLAPCAQSLMNNMDDQYEFTIYALSTDTLAITGTSVANALTALKAATPLGTAKLKGHAGLKGK